MVNLFTHFYFDIDLIIGIGIFYLKLVFNWYLNSLKARIPHYIRTCLYLFYGLVII